MTLQRRLTPNKARIQLLVDALRSDRFKQDQQALKWQIRKLDGTTSDRYCCLGVACEVAIENGLNLNVVKDEGSLFLVSPSKIWMKASFDGETGYLPEKAQDWYGLSNNPYLEPPPKKFKWYRFFWQEPDTMPILATEANDELRLTFSQIADAFERTYLE